MIKYIKIILAAAGFFCLFIQPVSADSTVSTDIKIIHASTGSNQIDPGLNAIIGELESVFKYTSYRLMKDEHLNLKFGQSGQVSLPDSRTLEVIASNTDGKRIQYQILIRESDHIIFKTQIALKNGSSITIGGPGFNNGTLLFNIAGSAR